MISSFKCYCRFADVHIRLIKEVASYPCKHQRWPSPCKQHYVSILYTRYDGATRTCRPVDRYIPSGRGNERTSGVWESLGHSIQPRIDGSIGPLLILLFLGLLFAYDGRIKVGWLRVVNLQSMAGVTHHVDQLGRHRFVSCRATFPISHATQDLLIYSLFGGRIVSWIIYCWLVWCERKTLFLAENLRSFTSKRTGCWFLWSPN